MGRGATATIERLAASLGGLDEAAPRFDPALDVSKGGVLLALPALLACGLLRHSGKYFRLPAGFYGLKTIFLLLPSWRLLGYPHELWPTRLLAGHAREHGPAEGHACLADTVCSRATRCHTRSESPVSSMRQSCGRANIISHA